MSRPAEAGSLKVGHLVIMDGEACKVIEVERSKPGKHGSAKVRIVAVGIFDGVKRSYVGPVDSRVEVPILERRSGQVTAITPSSVQVMDLETYETLWVNVPEEELKAKLSIGGEVEYWKSLNKTKIVKVKG
jgi:translation initiation factor 5A